jgi:hypothetical protein
VSTVQSLAEFGGYISTGMLAAGWGFDKVLQWRKNIVDNAALHTVGTHRVENMTKEIELVGVKVGALSTELSEHKLEFAAFRGKNESDHTHVMECNEEIREALKHIQTNWKEFLRQGNSK